VFSKFGQPSIVGMAVGVLIGGILQLSIQLPSLQNQGFGFSFYLNLSDEGLRRIILLMLPAIIGLSATQLNIFVNTFFASSCAQGSVSWLNYAFRLLMFPVGVIGVSLSISTMPVVSKFASKGEISLLKDAFISSTTLCFIFTIPSTFGLIFLSQPIIRLIFEHGKFSSVDTVNTASALSLYAIGLFAYAAVKIIVPIFYALNRTRYPVIGSFITVILNIIIVLLTLDALQYKAIALSTSLCVIVNFLLLCMLLYHEIEGYPIKYLLSCLIKILSISAAMGVGAYWLEQALRGLVGAGLLGQFFSLFITIICAIMFYFTTLYFMRIKEINYLTSMFRSWVEQRLS
jgi:putative peptidoglycan lipid II flippase